MKIRRTVIAIVVYNKKILFLKRDNLATIAEQNKWQFPGGHIEKSETPIQALTRELVEEVSYAPSNLTYLGKIKNNFREVSIFWSYVDNNQVKKFKLGEEGQKIKFMSVKQALACDLTKNVKFYLKNYKGLLFKHLENGTVPKIGGLK